MLAGQSGRFSELGANPLNRSGVEEFAHSFGDLFNVRLECEVSRVHKSDRGGRKILLIRLGTCRDKEGIVLSPDRHERRPVLTEVFVELRIRRDVVSVIEVKIQLDLHVSGTRDQSRVERIAFRGYPLRVRYAVEVLKPNAIGAK